MPDAGFGRLSAMEVQPERRDPWPVVGAASALGFMVVALLVTRRSDLAFDAWFSGVIQGLPVSMVFWEACSRAGGGTLILVGVGLVLGAILTRRPRLALIVAATLIAATFFTDLVKDYVARPRPPGADLIPTAGFSFPSGHALNSTTTYGLLALVVWRSGLPRPVRLAVVVVVGLTLPFLIGLSRVGLDVHHPSDVLGGWLAGIAFVALAATLIAVAHAMDRDPAATEAIEAS